MFVIQSQRMKVLDPQLSAEKRKEVQERMLGPDVLGVAVSYPQEQKQKPQWAIEQPRDPYG
jgi:hypothetical protein